MAAGVAAVNYARNRPALSSLIEEQPTRTEFLASSHFKISQDPYVTQPSLKSVFKVDYPPWDIHSKPPGAIPPKPAEIFQKDDRYFNIKASETRKEYEYRFLEKPAIISDADKLRGTNFKMDRDKRFNSFQTTHNAEFPPKEMSQYTSAVPTNDKMKSYIPQGDRDKAPEPVSDYKDRFRGIDATLHKPKVAINMHLSSAPTIQGDNRQHQFSTTHNDVYRGVTLPRINAFQAPVGTNIPQGDRNKEVILQTVQQASFQEHDLSLLNRYNRGQVMGKLQSTNFNQRDDRCNNYISTFKDSYRPVEGQTEKFEPGRHRNHSDFPTGDENDCRNAVRANMTTNRFYHGNPPPTKRPNIVYGANKRTKSNVWFGEPEHVTHFYDTTMNDNFPAYNVQHVPLKHGGNYESNIPTDYYKDGDLDFTTYRTDFMNPDQGKLQCNPAAIENLKETHIRPPQGDQRWFSTEHKEQYTPKSSTKVAIDPGRLQQSSVPIGTLNA